MDGTPPIGGDNTKPLTFLEIMSLFELDSTLVSN